MAPVVPRGALPSPELLPSPIWDSGGNPYFSPILGRPPPPSSSGEVPGLGHKPCHPSLPTSLPHRWCPSISAAVRKAWKKGRGVVLGRKGVGAVRGQRGHEGGRPVPAASAPYGGRRGPPPPCSHKAPRPWARHQSCGRDQLDGSHVWESSSGREVVVSLPTHTQPHLPHMLPSGFQGHPRADLPWPFEVKAKL